MTPEYLDSVSFAIEAGRLRMRISNAQAIEDPPSEQTERIVMHLAKVTNQELLLYNYHTTGRTPGHSSDRLTLFFTCYPSVKTVCIHFNVSCRRQRNSPGGVKGGKRPAGEFTPPKSGTFMKFWQRLELPAPARLSTFKSKLHLLNHLVLQGDIVTKNDQSVVPDRVLARVNMGFEEASGSVKNKIAEISTLQEQFSDRQLASNGHAMDMEHVQGFVQTPLATRPAAKLQCVPSQARIKTSEQVTTPHAGHSYGYASLAPEEQSNALWLDEYCNHKPRYEDNE